MRWLDETGALDHVCERVANGESVLDVCAEKGVPYSEFVRWVEADPVRKQVWEASRKQSNEWYVKRLVDELRTISLMDIRQAFLTDGRLKPINELPERVAAAVQSVEYDGAKVKVKFFDKLKALEMLGKHVKLFQDQAGPLQVSLADLVEASQRGKAPAEPAALQPPAEKAEGA